VDKFADQFESACLHSSSQANANLFGEFLSSYDDHVSRCEDANNVITVKLVD
jgi:hypothetical protein